MKILVTGAKGFVGKNLCAALRNIRDGKDRRFPELKIEVIFEYDLDSTPEELDAWCKDCDFVFNLAGVNRPKETFEFMEGNFGFASTLLDTLKKHGNKCPVMLSSSQQASLTGRFGNSEYGRSKKAGEDLFLEYERDFLKGSLRSKFKENLEENLEPRVLIYRFPNLFGKWCRPNYNSAVATFCNAFANDLPYTVNDPSVELELLYIDDLVEEMIRALSPLPTSPSRGGDCPYKTADPALYEQLKEKAEEMRKNPTEAESAMWEMLRGKNLDAKFRRQHIIGDYIVDFVCLDKQLVVELDGGYHNDSEQKELDRQRTKFLQSKGFSVLRFTNEEVLGNTGETLSIISNALKHLSTPEGGDGGGLVLNWFVDGDHIQAVHMLPGYTHNIINLSETENLVTVMYCNEIFDSSKPDTFFEPV